MADIPSASVKMNDIEISSDAPVTESLFTKMGGNINDGIDQDISIANTVGLLDTRVGVLETFNSDNSSAFTQSTASIPFVDVTGSSITMTNSSGKIQLDLQPAQGTIGYIACTGGRGFVQILRGAIVIGGYRVESILSVPGFTVIDRSSSTGSQTYKVQIGSETGDGTIFLVSMELFVREF